MIKSHFQHRGFDIRLKEYHADYIMYFVRTPSGPITGGAKSILEARRKAIEVVNDYTAGDWRLNTPGTLRLEAGDGDDFGRTRSLRGVATREAS